VNLEIITGTGYTVYDKEQGIAYVQVARGPDNMTLHGMELMIDFDGTTYKTTLRAPNPNGDKSYFFDMTEMQAVGKLPGMVSVAPIFILDARQILGQITSKVAMPIMSIAKNKAEIIAELEEKNEPIINLTVENVTQSNLCGTTVGEDPWGGCPIATGDIYSVRFDPDGPTYRFDATSSEEPDLGSTAEAYLKFGGSGNCIPLEYNGECIVLKSGTVPWWSINLDKLRITLKNTQFNNLIQNNCGQNNWFYIYKNSDCKN
jgi:hypothetical protein